MRCLLKRKSPPRSTCQIRHVSSDPVSDLGPALTTFSPATHLSHPDRLCHQNVERRSSKHGYFSGGHARQTILLVLGLSLVLTMLHYSGPEDPLRRPRRSFLRSHRICSRTSYHYRHILLRVCQGIRTFLISFRRLIFSNLPRSRPKMTKPFSNTLNRLILWCVVIRYLYLCHFYLSCRPKNRGLS
jgi:hypothetical protein